MSWQRTGGFALIGMLLTTAAGADVIPFFGSKQRTIYHGGIEMKFERLPKGVAVLYLDDQGVMSDKVGEKGTLAIYRAGTVYAAGETLSAGELSIPTKRGKLYELRKLEESEFPTRPLKPPEPKRLSCEVTGEASRGYTLVCNPDKDRE